jgi:hypothetical protein
MPSTNGWPTPANTGPTDLSGPCPGCGRYPPSRGEDLGGDLPVEYTTPTLRGWHPCLCGGHETRWCSTWGDDGGCGAEMWDPPRGDKCRDPWQGFGATPSSEPARASR